MNYKNYIKEGIKISELGFGAWQLGIESGWSSVSEKESEYMINTALDSGINFFDTAPNYGNGTSETRLGKVLKNVDRSKIVINTKFGRLDNGTVDFDSKHIVKSIESSLRRLKTDYVDSAIIHSPPIEILNGNQNDHYEILEKLQDEGKIIEYGASIDFFDEIKTLIQTTNAKVIQAFFNIFHQDVRRAFEIINKYEVAVIAKIPFDSGWLTGKYDEKSVFNGVRSRWSNEDKAVRSALVKKVKEIISENTSIKSAALSFCSFYKEISTVIPGAISTKQLTDNIKSISNNLDSESVRELESLYENEIKDLKLPW